MKGNAGRGNQLSYGTFGIKSLDSNFLNSRQIEAARIAATRYMKREGSLWIMIFPGMAARVRARFRAIEVGSPRGSQGAG